MKLRNKKTGEIVENAYVRESHDFYNKRTIAVFVRDGNRPPERVSTGYNSLTELNEEWEDYEELKGYYFIRSESLTVDYLPISNSRSCRNRKAIGNYFETEEEAEKAVEKLKAFKRLKDKGMIKYSFHKEKRGIDLDFYILTILAPRDEDSLNLLFGGEE